MLHSTEMKGISRKTIVWGAGGNPSMESPKEKKKLRVLDKERDLYF